MGIKIYGPHIQDIVDFNYMMAWIKTNRPKIVKIMEDNPDFIKACQEYVGFWLYRAYTEDQSVENPDKSAQKHYDRLMSKAAVQYMRDTGILFACEGFNEINTGHAQDFNKLCEMDIELARLLRKEGILYCGGSVGVGHPALHYKDYWPIDINDPSLSPEDRARAVPLHKYEPFLEALVAVDFYAVHEYYAPRMDDVRNLDPNEPGTGWWLMRYRKWWPKLAAEYRKPLIISETGIDSGAPHFWPGAQGGWQSFGSDNMDLKIQDTIAQLEVYGEALVSDGVYGATPFLWGTKDKVHWATFDWLEPRASSEAFGTLVRDGIQVVEPEFDWVDIRDTIQKHENYPYGDEHIDEFLYKTRSLTDIDTIVIHHTGWVPVGPDATARYHVEDKGWPAVGYHIMIVPDGTVYYMNDFSISSFHAKKFNSTSVGIALEGDFMNGNRPTGAQMNSATKLLRDLRTYFQYDYVVGHKELLPTDCPGDSWDVKELLPEEENWQQRALMAEALNIEYRDLVAEVHEMTG